MELVGLFIIISVWGFYCGLESFNPLTVALAILNSPTGAAAIIAQAKAQRDSTVAVSSGATAANPSAVTGGPSTVSGGDYLQLGGKSLTGTYGPFSGYTISDSFAGHLARHSTAPGIDFTMPSGTTLYSPFSGTVINRPNYNGAAGNQVAVKLANGYTFAIDHVKGFLLGNGTHISAGTAIALSGGGANDPGKGDATGPHAHVQLQTPSGQYVPFNSIKFG